MLDQQLVQSADLRLLLDYGSAHETYARAGGPIVILDPFHGPLLLLFNKRLHLRNLTSQPHDFREVRSELSQSVNVLRFQIGTLLLKLLQQVVLSQHCDLLWIRFNHLVQRFLLSAIAFRSGQIPA